MRGSESDWKCVENVPNAWKVNINSESAHFV